MGKEGRKESRGSGGRKRGEEKGGEGRRDPQFTFLATPLTHRSSCRILACLPVIEPRWAAVFTVHSVLVWTAIRWRRIPGSVTWTLEKFHMPSALGVMDPWTVLSPAAWATNPVTSDRVSVANCYIERKWKFAAVGYLLGKWLHDRLA